MKLYDTNKKTESLGTLKLAKKTKPRSPDMTGHANLQRHTLEEILRQLKHGGGEEVPCNLAAWRYSDEDGGKYLSVEISPCFKPKEWRRSKSDIFDQLFGGDNEN